MVVFDMQRPMTYIPEKPIFIAMETFKVKMDTGLKAFH